MIMHHHYTLLWIIIGFIFVWMILNPDFDFEEEWQRFKQRSRETEENDL